MLRYIALVSAIVALGCCRPTRVILRNDPTYAEYTHDDRLVMYEVLPDYDDYVQDMVIVRRPIEEVFEVDYEPTLLGRLANAWDALTN